MPVQCLIRKLTKVQVDRLIADQKARITVTQSDGALLLIVTASADGEGKDPAGNAALQKIADIDAAIMQEEREKAAAAAAAERAAKFAADTAAKTDTPPKTTP